jgi:hypothetical protein
MGRNLQGVEANRMRGSLDEAIWIAATWYIRKHCMHEGKWRYTRLLALGSPTSSKVVLARGELGIVSCEISQESWYFMTSRRLTGQCKHMRFDAQALDIDEWKWGDFKTGRTCEAIREEGWGPLNLEPKVGDAKIRCRSGVEHSFQYETGHASMAPIYYAHFWTVKYPALQALNIDRLRRELQL